VTPIRVFTPRLGLGASRRRPPLLSAALVMVMVVAAASPAAGAAPVRTERPWTPGPATYQTVLEPDVRVAMSDGVRLTVDVLRPADATGQPAAGRFPVVLTQTPYNKKPGVAQTEGRSGLMSYRNEFLVRRGYVQVIAEVRGTGSSEGTHQVFGRREQLDGAELVAWAASPERPWSNGRVALLGSSAAGFSALLTAALQPPGLRAIFPVSAVGDLYRDFVMQGGQADTSFIPLWFSFVSAFGLLPPTYSPADPGGAAASVGDHARHVPATVQLAGDSGGGGDLSYDGPWWRERSPLEVAGQIRVPAFLVGGWHDLFQRSTPMLFERLVSAGVPARLVVGPWDHWDLVGYTSGPSRLTLDGYSLEEWQLRWFDHHVEGRSDPQLAAMPPVTYCPVGRGTCSAAPSWPPPGVSYQPLFLGGPGTRGGNGTLSHAPPAKQPPDVLVWHPGSGGCSRSWTQWGWTPYSGVDGPCDTDQRANDTTGLVYDLPLRDDLRIAGPIGARLFVATNGSDGFLSLRLEDVAPDGSVIQLSSGGLVLSLRALDRERSLVADGFVVRPHHPFTRASVLPVQDGQIYELSIEIFATAATLPAGHTLRLAVQSSDWPHQTASMPQTAAFAGNILHLHHGPDHPSALVLPVEP